jgi:NADPH:quinone reductase-like Zn-dependent oxidoreductase
LKAIYFERHGGPEVLLYGDRPMPKVGADEVLIEVRAAAVNPRDWMLRAGTYFARHIVKGPPTIPGSDVSGVVAAVGAKATGFAVGDEVFAMQHQFGNMGGYAEFLAVKATCVAPKPRNVSYVEAAAVGVAGLTALQVLRDIAKVQPGQQVTIVGASGGVGHYAVQLAHHLGAHVTAVCSGANAEFARRLGADTVVDYTTTKFNDVLTGQDLVFDTIGRESPRSVRSVLGPDGWYVTTIPNARTAAQWVGSSLLSPFRGGQRTGLVMVRASGRDLTEIAALMGAGVVTSEVSRVFLLQDAAQAHRESRTFRTRGKIVLTVKS